MSPGATQAWLVWAVPAFLFFFAFLHRVLPGVMAKELMQAFQAGGAIVGHLSAAYFYAYAGLMLPAGLLIDAFGPRRVVAAGGAVMGLGTLAMALAPDTAMLFAGRLLVGLGATVTFIGALKVAAVWFPPERFATLSAITATVGVLGSLAGTAPLAALVAAAGWRGALGLIAALTLLGAALTLRVVRDRPGSGAAVAAPMAPGLAEVAAGTRAVLGNPHTWPPFLAFFFLYAAVGNLMLWAVPYLRDVYGLSLTRAAGLATAQALALLVSAPLTGYLSDRVLERRKLPYAVAAWASLGLWVAFVLTLGALPPWGVFALFFAMGTVGGAFVLTWPIGREVNPPALAGIAVAVVNLGGFLGAALTQGPVGAVLDARWAGAMVAGARAYPVEAYRTAFTACAAFMLASALITLFLRETRGQNIYARLRGLPRGGSQEATS
jgi:MFS family permease